MIESQLIILQQANTYLASVSEQQYTQVISPTFMSSAGAHMRHILDHYYSVINGFPEGLIDYDKRSRGGVIESCPKAAQKSNIWFNLDGDSKNALFQWLKAFVLSPAIYKYEPVL